MQEYRMQLIADTASYKNAVNVIFLKLNENYMKMKLKKIGEKELNKNVIEI